MKISAINTGNSFGRVIQVKNATNPDSTRSSAKELIRVLNNSGSKVYSDEQQNKIRTFFQDVLGDYDGYGSIMARKTKDGKNVLISGKDYEALKNIELKHIAKPHKTKRDSEQYKDKYDKEINKRLEDGKKSRPESMITLFTGDNKKISSINFESYTETYALPKGEEPIENDKLALLYGYDPNVFLTVKYENKNIDINA